jgi:ParB/RepB/Spo0J family partition protein
MKVSELKVADLKVSKDNVRQMDDLKDLAASIKEKGILQPLLVTDKGEIIAGARRFKAAQMAGLETVPCVVREDAEEAQDLRVIENLQRENLPPLDEAQAIDKMRKAGVDIEEISKRIGKTKGYVYQRLSLLELPASAQKLIKSGELPISSALLLLRVDPTRREAFFKGLGEWRLKDFDIVKEAVEAENLILKKATWKLNDPTVLPDAGACSQCQKRTGRDPSLFQGLTENDTCLDIKCWKNKEKAAQAVKIAQYEAKGKKLVVGAEAKRIENGSAYCAMNERSYQIRSNLPMKQLLKDKEVETVFIEREDGKVAEYVKLSDAIKVLPKSVVGQQVSRQEDPKERARREKAEAIDELVSKMALGLVMDKVEKSGLTTEVLRLLVEMVDDNVYADDKPEIDYKKAKPSEMHRFLAACLFLENFEDQMIKLCKIDTKALREKAKEEYEVQQIKDKADGKKPAVKAEEASEESEDEEEDS